MDKMMRKILHRAVGMSGFEISRRPSDNLQDLRSGGASPTPAEGAYLSEKQGYIVDVPVALLGRTGLLKLWCTVLEAYARHGEAAARKCLQEYFDAFQPGSVAEFLGIPPTQAWHHGHPLSYVYPWEVSQPEEKWRWRNTLMAMEAREHGFSTWAEPDGWKGFGPVSSGIVDMELRRLMTTYESISRHGFDERHGHVLGRIYGWGADEMILPRRGWHRVAVCLTLDMERIPMSFDRRHVIIRHEDASRWPNVKNGRFSIDEAKKIFEKRFRSTLTCKRDNSHELFEK